MITRILSVLLALVALFCSGWGLLIGVGFAGAAFLTGVFSSEWIDHLDGRSPGELLLMTASVFAPVFAVLLTSAQAPEQDRGPESAR
jgi:hypothetical protein